jgi:hypothetical protein
MSQAILKRQNSFSIRCELVNISFINNNKFELYHGMFISNYWLYDERNDDFILLAYEFCSKYQIPEIGGDHTINS